MSVTYHEKHSDCCPDNHQNFRTLAQKNLFLAQLARFVPGVIAQQTVFISIKNKRKNFSTHFCAWKMDRLITFLLIHFS